MAGVIKVYQAGGPEQLHFEEVEVGEPGPGEVRLRQTAIGLNFIDVYFRTGLYPTTTPFIPGFEAAGVVDAVGEGVDDLKVGQRVAYAAAPLLGAYAQSRLIPANRVVAMPDSISDDQAAAMMLQGMTAEYLLCRTYKVQPGQTILFHAAAGGVGLIACQWAKQLGAVVIGTVGSDAKAEIAIAHGCDHVIRYDQENVVERVKAITGGAGVPVVYDSVGKTTFDSSLDCLAPRGTLVSFGQSSGSVPPLNIGILSQKGSLYLTRPTLVTYIADRNDLVASAKALFDMVGGGKVKIEINQRFPLREAAEAHRALEGRQTTGSTILQP